MILRPPIPTLRYTPFPSASLFRSAAAIDADGELAPRLAGFDVRVDQRCGRREGEVVDNLPAQILEHFEHGRLARARQAGDEQQPRFGILAHAAGASRSSASRILIGADASNADSSSPGSG